MGGQIGETEFRSLMERAELRSRGDARNAAPAIGFRYAVAALVAVSVLSVRIIFDTA